MSAKGKTLLKGHTLRREGQAFDERGRWLPNEPYGCGKCSCGEVSVPLHTDAARKRWHRAHKDSLR